MQPSCGAIVKYVRGDLRLSDLLSSLRKIDVEVRIGEHRIEMVNPRLITETASMRDIAAGFVARLGNIDEMKEWARIVICGSSFLDLSEEFDNLPEGDVLLNALWDAMAGVPPRGSTLDMIRELSGGENENRQDA